MSQDGALWDVAGRQIAISHPDEVYWPEDGITKGEMLRYYLEVAPALLPHLLGRPLTTRVFPDGIHGPSFYRRHLEDDAPDWLPGVAYRPASTGRIARFPVVEDAAGLLWLANRGGIEFHPWLARLPDLAQPDQAVFDLDPGEHASFAAVLAAAARLREALERLGLRGYPKTTGGRGLHVYLPLAPGHDFAVVRSWVKSVAGGLAGTWPDLIAVASGPTHRGDHVTVDYAQNGAGRNSAAPYTLRGRPGAPVSTPLTWDEVAAGRIDPAALGPRAVRARLQRHGDLFAPALAADQRLPAP